MYSAGDKIYIYTRRYIKCNPIATDTQKKECVCIESSWNMFISIIKFIYIYFSLTSLCVN